MVGCLLVSASAANAARDFGVPVANVMSNGVLPSERKWCLFFMGVPVANKVSGGVFIRGGLLSVDCSATRSVFVA